MGEVIPLRCKTILDTSPESVLNGAIEHGLEQVFVLGWKDGEPYFAGSSSDVGAALVLFEKFKKAIV